MRPDLGLFMVCDGMGGYSAGEVAASIAAETAKEFFEGCQRDPEGTWPFKVDQALGEEGSRLPVALRLANQRIRQAAQGDAQQAQHGDHRGGGLPGARTQTYVAHAGDSRAYLFRDGKLWAITADHSLLGEFIRSQHPTRRGDPGLSVQERHQPRARPGGRREGRRPLVEMRVGDTLLLCCDGLHGMVSDELIAQILWTHPVPRGGMRALVDAANAAGGSDNITVVLVRRH